MKLWLVFIGFLMYHWVAALSVDEILDMMEANQNPKSSKSEITQIIYTSKGKENRSHMLSWGKGGGESQLMEYVSPKRVKGMKILMLNDGDDIWTYFPRTGRVRKIASHQRNASVNGSDFSYEDLSTKDQRKDYHVSLAGEENKSGASCYQIVMKAKDKKKSYQQMIFWVDKSNFVALAAEFYDEDTKLWKVLSTAGVEKIGDYWTAKSIEMKNVQKGSRTVVTLEKMEFDIPMADEVFSERNLKK